MKNNYNQSICLFSTSKFRRYFKFVFPSIFSNFTKETANLDVQFINKRSVIFFLFILFNLTFLENLSAQGASCATATTLDVNTIYSGSITDATVNDVVGGSCNGQSIVRDGWVKFVATGTEATIRATANRNPVLFAYSGTCSLLALINCANVSTGSSSSSSQTEVLNLSGLTAGNTYFVRVANTNNNDMTVSSFEIFTNNNCTGAIPLTVNAGTSCTVQTSGSTVGATQSLAAITCGSSSGNADDDVWYSFIATQTNQTITANAGTISDIVLDLRSGSCNGSNINCADSTNSGGSETINATGLTIGATYYIRVYSYGNSSNAGSFTICVRETNNCIVYPPTSVTASSTAVCVGNSTTLQAVGGTTGASTLWFQGSCGNVAFSEEWNSASIPYTSVQTTINSLSGGILNVTSQNVALASSDPQISMENIFSTAINPVTYKNIAIRYKVVSGTPYACEIYFKKAGQSLAEDKVVRENLIGDANWHIVNVDMSTNSNWNNTGGNITGWRFDYTRGPNVNMQIDYIVLTDKAVLENTNADENTITVTPTLAITDYYAMRIAESTCFATTLCTSVKIYRNKTWAGGSTGDWGVATNWVPVGVPTTTDCIDVTTSLNMTGTGINGYGKTLNVSAGDFVINAGNSLSIKEALTVGAGATFTLESTASLVQEGTTNTNSGNIIVKREAKPMKRYDYTYWSSPVASQTLYNLSPTTFYDKFYSWNATTQAWAPHNYGAETMSSAKGYIVRAPQSFPILTVNPSNFVGQFTGKPNSGDITIDVKGNTSSVVANYKWNLIGNPYPSAIKIDEFLTDSFNSSKIYGTIYLWTHNSPPSNAIPGDYGYNYTASDYASYNGVGGTATKAAVADPLHPVINPSPNSNVPNGFVASGQSFFIRGKADAIVKFTNDMRERNDNNQFFRNANSNFSTTSIEKNRYWLNIRNDEGAFNQTLIGYLQGATDDLDDGFDGEVFGGNFVTIYSIVSGKNLTIQGKGLPLETSDVISLGIKTTISGNFTISLDMFDGFFSDQNIYLKDKLLNVIHDLKTGGYAFSATVGTFNDRFEIVYQNSTLGIEDPEFNPQSIIIYKKDKTIVVNSGISIMKEVQVFDIQGRLLYDGKNINNSETIIKDLPPVDQVLIIQVHTTEGNKVSKKIIF